MELMGKGADREGMELGLTMKIGTIRLYNPFKRPSRIIDRPPRPDSAAGRMGTTNEEWIDQAFSTGIRRMAHSSLEVSCYGGARTVIMGPLNSSRGSMTSLQLWCWKLQHIMRPIWDWYAVSDAWLTKVLFMSSKI